MIIIGYQGIGKSTLSKGNGYIDLESGNFFVNGKRSDDWYIPYCSIAEHLSKQGNIVFVSSHEVVRRQLENSSETVLVCFPSLQLKEKWIKKLKDRYDETKMEKDYKAYKNAELCYDDNIKALISENYHKIIIDTFNYDLKTIISKSVNELRACEKAINDLENYAKENNVEYFEIIENRFEYLHEFLFISYRDKEHKFEEERFTVNVFDYLD